MVFKIFFIKFINQKKALQNAKLLRIKYAYYFFWYITSFTSLTVRGTSGKAAATRFGA